MVQDDFRLIGIKPKRRFHRPILWFLLILSICALFCSITIKRKLELQQLSINQVVTEKSIAITDLITKLLYKTQILAAVLAQGNGVIEDFDTLAATIIDNPAIINVLLAPGGIVSHVYPVDGNEAVYGYNLLGEGAGNKEAILAKDLGQLVFGGPFDLVQGGQALVGRLPVWLSSEEGEKKFWGIVSVTLKYPEVLNSTNLEGLSREGLAYELWRISPDTGEKQIIASSGYTYNKNAHYLEKGLHILNAEWWFRIMPVRLWYEYPDTWMMILSSLFISGLVALMVRNNDELKHIKSRLESLVHTDALTGLYNRAGLFDRLEYWFKQNEPFTLLSLDLDRFKQVNTSFSRQTGDFTLIECSRRIQRHIRPGWVLARLNGDEFVLAYAQSQTSPEVEKQFRQDIEKALSQSFYAANGDIFSLNYSMGAASFPADGKTGNALLNHAQTNMHKQKNRKYANDFPNF